MQLSTNTFPEYSRLLMLLVKKTINNKHIEPELMFTRYDKVEMQY